MLDTLIIAAGVIDIAPELPRLLCAAAAAPGIISIHCIRRWALPAIAATAMHNALSRMAGNRWKESKEKA